MGRAVGRGVVDVAGADGSWPSCGWADSASAVGEHYRFSRAVAREAPPAAARVRRVLRAAMRPAFVIRRQGL
ncbi:MAG: hypothetical protein M3422_06340 [Actinomycetota bacterium]|nr:hypothetical protein [Actinomycetota bacterium]